MTTAEGNTLIGEFMGIDDYELFLLFGPEHYDKSWDLLMPVVKKIKDIKREPGDDLILAIIMSNINSALVLCDIEKIRSSVIDFIKWYNQNK